MDIERDFWSVEVKAGDTVKVDVLDRQFDFITVTNATLVVDEKKKKEEKEAVYLYVKIGSKNFVITTLSAERRQQPFFELYFRTNFELYHTAKHATVQFVGSSITLEEKNSASMAFLKRLASVAQDNKPASESAGATKPGSGEAKRVRFANASDEDTDDSSDEEDEDESSDDQALMTNGEHKEDDKSDDEDSDDEDDESDDEGDESDDEEEETPKKVQLGRKRLAESSVKTPPLDKKVKLATPLKREGKKASGHVATPHPSKHVSKAPANSDQKREQTPKSIACKSCNRLFGSENALESHTKAKHSAAK